MRKHMGIIQFRVMEVTLALQILKNIMVLNDIFFVFVPKYMIPNEIVSCKKIKNLKIRKTVRIHRVFNLLRNN